MTYPSPHLSVTSQTRVRVKVEAGCPWLSHTKVHIYEHMGGL